MELLDSTVIVIATTTTNRNGNYYFSGLTVSDGGVTYLSAGSVRQLRFRRRAGRDDQQLCCRVLNTIHTGNPVTLTTDNYYNLAQDFSYKATDNRKIGNLLWLDVNKDSVYNSGSETAHIGNVTNDLYRDLNGNGQLDPGEPLTETRRPRSTPSMPPTSVRTASTSSLGCRPANTWPR